MNGPARLVAQEFCPQPVHGGFAFDAVPVNVMRVFMRIARAIEALGPTGIFAKEPSPQRELRELEMKLARTGGTSRLEFLPQVAKLAFWTGDTIKAERYAMEALRLVPPSDTLSEAEATHDGNMVLGLVALHRGDTERAKLCLLESARTNGSDFMSMTGPNLSLASELLKHHERDAVIGYLRECRRFWVDGRKTLDIWSRASLPR